MTTAKEFLKSGVTGQTFREIREKFGKGFNALAEEDAIWANYALGFAWIREREQLPVEAAYDKALKMSVGAIEALFEDGKDPKVAVEADFDLPPLKTTP